MQEAGKGAALTIGFDIANKPGGRCAVVGGKQRVLGGMAVDRLGQIGSRNCSGATFVFSDRLALA